ncbi:MAG: DNA polymerase I [Ignavibacteria bacterium]|nr:DNA polymerase I [Ignavibacteria bacterium]MBK6420116.1 DNA polymerase I [Ignavibacteria bacterium]MBK7184975.1 DNA polymerase I [Ignavibacteria bacterium]MBK9181980.1 DNA polymerase I [Ignavibacteria bacterium]MBL0321562.1 DNA polymerase I [Ignavibacteria bacterium]
MRPLILIDGMSLVFRAYHALLRTGMQSPSGEPTFAVFAFTNILTSLLDKHNPDAIAVIFDTPEPTFRHILYDQYKAHRDAFPEDLVPQLQRIKQLIGLMGLEMVEMPGFEADDIVGTICRRESDDGHEILCVTSDKDYFQLVNDKVKILRPGKDVGQYDVMDATSVKTKFGVGPEHVIDVLALIGDSSDNVPGVKGVGEKTAIPLIEQFGTLENLYEHLDDVERVSVRTKLEEHRDMAFLSKTLVTIHTDVPIDAKRIALVRRPMDITALDSFCEELGFHTLRRKFAKYGQGNDEVTQLQNDGGTEGRSDTVTEGRSDGLKKLSDVEHSYVLVDTPGGLSDMMNELKGATLLSVDLETTGLDAMRCAIVGIALSAAEGTGYYIDVDDSAIDNAGSLFADHTERHGLPLADVLTVVKPMLTDPSVGKCGQNLKYDMLILKRYGVDVAPVAFDTMLASYVLDPDKLHNLDALSERWLHYAPISITTLIGEKKGQQKSMRDVDAARVAEYAAEDADLALKLTNLMRPELEKEGLLDFAQKVEFASIPVLVTMENNGICIDTKALGGLGEFMRSEAVRLEAEIWKEAGREFTVGSPKQLAEVLFEDLMLPSSKKTKTGYSTDSSVLTELAESYPIAQMVLDYRQVEKLRSTYVESLPRLINPTTGRVHTTFNQTVAATGRLSSTDPNLQNIPVRTELGQQIRKAFVPQHADHVILSADYSQIELRIMASFSKDPNLIAAFASGADIHSATAAILFDVPIDAVSGDQRRVAKTVNFGIMYGQGAFGLSQGLGIPRAEAQQIIENYFVKYAGIKNYIDETVAVTRERGYASTLLGRRRYFPTINASNRGLRTAAERAAINMPIQGTAADMIKLAMIRVHQRMQREGLRSLLMLQVHDELVFEAHVSEIEALTKVAKEEMEQALPLENVPVIVETGKGASWYEAH